MMFFFLGFEMGSPSRQGMRATEAQKLRRTRGQVFSARPIPRMARLRAAFRSSRLDHRSVRPRSPLHHRLLRRWGRQPLRPPVRFVGRQAGVGLAHRRLGPDEGLLVAMVLRPAGRISTSHAQQGLIVAVHRFLRSSPKLLRFPGISESSVRSKTKKTFVVNVI